MTGPGTPCPTFFPSSRVTGKSPPEDLARAEEVFLTATSCGLFPVTRLDGKKVGQGVPGPVTTRLLNTYYERKNAGWRITAVETIR